MFWQMLPSKEVDEVGDTVSGSIGPTLTWFGHSVPCLWQKICLIPSFILIKWPSLSSLCRDKKNVDCSGAQLRIKQQEKLNTPRLQAISTTQQGDSISKECKMSLIWSTRIIRYQQLLTATCAASPARPRASLWQGWEAGATLPCHWFCYLCQSPVQGSHSCIDIRLVSPHPMSGSAPAPVNIAADHRAGLSSQLTQWQQQQNKQTKKNHRSRGKEPDCIRACFISRLTKQGTYFGD